MSSASFLGLHRVIGEPQVLPQPAERLNARMPCQDTELEIAVDCLHVDATSLSQLRRAHEGDLKRVHEAILELVQRRGKLHNPATNSGGMLAGTVRRVGSRFQGAPAIGARIASLVSLSLTPLCLEHLGPVDARSNSISVRGTAFLCQSSPWALLPADLPEEA